MITGLLWLPAFVIFTFWFLLSNFSECFDFVSVFYCWWALPKPAFLDFTVHPRNHPTTQPTTLWTHSTGLNRSLSAHKVLCWSGSRLKRTVKEARGILPFQISPLLAVSCLSPSSLFCNYSQSSFSKVIDDKSGSHCLQETWWALGFLGS